MHNYESSNFARTKPVYPPTEIWPAEKEKVRGQTGSGNNEEGTGTTVQATEQATLQKENCNSKENELSTDTANELFMLIPHCRKDDVEIHELLSEAPLEPPTTRSTLRELELTCIMHNISLRVDVVYDMDLHFLPIQGLRGIQKKRDSDRYFDAIAAEIDIINHDLQSCRACHRAQTRGAKFQPRLKIMFTELRVLLELLIPEKDQYSITENLEIDYLMAQVAKGVADIGRLSAWLDALLKRHCAPIRDEWADSMAEKISHGARQGDATLLAEGLKRLFKLLEAMKLVCQSRLLQNETLTAFRMSRTTKCAPSDIC